jgi:hypothetical protein
LSFSVRLVRLIPPVREPFIISLFILKIIGRGKTDATLQEIKEVSDAPEGIFHGIIHQSHQNVKEKIHR